MDSADATIPWPPFTADSEKYLVLGLRMKIEQRLLPDRVAFWNDFIPKLSATEETVGKSSDKRQSLGFGRRRGSFSSTEQ